MNYKTIINSLRHIAIVLVAIGVAGAANHASAQKSSKIQVQGPLTLQFGPNLNPTEMDFSGDHIADIVIVDTADAKWIVYSADNYVTTQSFGSALDYAVPADYDGDGIEDIAVLQSAEGLLNWHILQSSDNAIVDFSWGVDGDVAVQGDYDGDGRVDIAVWRPSDALWHIRSSNTGDEIILECGMLSDKPMPGDYDGDGRTDAAIYRSEEHAFYYLSSITQTMIEQPFGPFAMNRDVTFVPADYDGDGRTDFAMMSPSSRIWTILESSTGEYRQVSVEGAHKPCIPVDVNPCTVTDFALPADYDNDGKVDPAIWSSQDGTVHAEGSNDGPMKITTDAANGMVAVSSFYMTH